MFQIGDALIENPLQLGKVRLICIMRNCRLQLLESLAERDDEVLGGPYHISRISVFGSMPRMPQRKPANRE